MEKFQCILLKKEARGLKPSLKVTKNTASLVSREALNKGALFILLVLIGRFLGKEALGRYSLALVISQIFFFGSELGLNTLIVREVATEKSLAGKFLLNTGALRVLTGAITLGLIWVITGVVGAKGEAARAIYLCAIAYFFVNITSIYTSVFRAFERMELDLVVAFIRNVIFLPFAAMALYSGQGIAGVFIVLLISSICALIFAHLTFIKQIGTAASPTLRIDLDFCKDQLRQTSPLWLSQLFGIAYLKIAPILLFRLQGEGAVGIYNAGLVVVDGFWVLAGCFVYSIFPVISRIGLREARAEYLNGLKFIISAFLALAAMVALAAGWLVPLFYGQKFIEVIPLFRLFALISILIAIDTHNGMAIIAVRRQSVLPFINAAALALNFSLNVFLIPRFGYTGSAYALFLSESMVFVLMLVVLKRSLLAAGGGANA
ncbi:MAG: flippase [Candidatus Omnitrophica bacterium]|nr:flippase [Candidatus Omnitrophota bacterium]